MEKCSCGGHGKTDSLHVQPIKAKAMSGMLTTEPPDNTANRYGAGNGETANESKITGSGHWTE